MKVFKEDVQKDIIYKYRTFMLENRVENKAINKLFRQTRKNTAIAFDFTYLFK